MTRAPAKLSPAQRSDASPTAAGANDPAKLSALGPDERFDALGSSPAGLATQEVARRTARCGPNAVRRAASFSWPGAIAANFTHPLALLLWFGAVMAYAADAPELAAAIVCVVAINGIFALLQEYRAERVVEALLRRAALSARVVRGGAEQLVPASALVPGDLVLLAAGDVVPADCVLVRADGLSLDLSLLTGETRPIARSVEPSPSDADACTAPAGAGVVRGSARALVAATGRNSTLGRIEALLVETERGRSLLERQVAELSRLTGIIAVLCGVATLSLAIAFRSTGIVAALTFATGVIVALVPEGLLPLLTVSLAMAARRMAARGALVRRLSAVEVVGASSVICTDKTGTLTRNTLAVLAFVPSPGTRDAVAHARLVAALCNDAGDGAGGATGDPIDRALLAWTADDAHALRARHARLSAAPFDPVRRYMRVDCAFPGGARQLVKGAPEAVAALVGAPLPAELADAIADAAGRGERVLLLAAGPAETAPEYVGLLRFHDPPRPEVPAAISACHRAGIRVLMLTGDHPATARAIAARIGLCDGDADVLEGAAIDALDDRALVEQLRDVAILARTTPEQKLRIVRALRAAGEVVTVTGDGVNDAPALRVADVGIAMGRRGTEVAKQASDIVLLDDNFATIVAAIEEGRTIKRNIRRFASYVFTSNVAELVPFLFYIFLPVPLPLTILQVLAIDLGTDMLPALALGIEPPAPGALAAAPEPPRSPILTRSLALRTFLFYGLIESALGMAGYFAAFWAAGWRPFANLAPSHAAAGATLTFLGIIGGQIGCLFAQRDGGLLARLSWQRNPWIALGLAVELVLALTLVYVPGIGAIFEMAAVSPAWLLVLPAAAAIFTAVDQLRRGL